MLVSLLLAACTTPEEAAANAALAYLRLPLDAHADHLAAICVEDRATTSVEAMQADQAATGAEVVAKAKAELAKLTFTAKATQLDSSGTAATVTVEARAEPGGKTATRETSLRLEDGKWCVVTGWAQMQRDLATAQGVADLVGRALDETLDWKLDDASATLASARDELGKLAPDNPLRGSSEEQLAKAEGLVAARKTGWAGGRWRVTAEKDPMTDAVEVTAALASVDGLPNVIGEMKPASIIARCARGKLDVYVNTDTILDSDYRYDSVSGQHRFGSAAAERFSGSVSTDRKAVFLRDPGRWLAQFEAHEAESWAVELPIYNRRPAAVTFDLAAAGKALPQVRDACR